MGGTCSGAKSSQAITPNSVNELNSVAHDSLRKMQAGGKHSTPSKSKLGDSLSRGTPKIGEEANVYDLAADLPTGVTRKHETLWQAIEKEDNALALKYLDKLGDTGVFEESDLVDSSGQSMLHRAAQLGHAEMLMLLLERSGSKPDLPNAQLATPLHLACRHDREGVVRFLIGCGVDVN